MLIPKERNKVPRKVRLFGMWKSGDKVKRKTVIANIDIKQRYTVARKVSQ